MSYPLATGEESRRIVFELHIPEMAALGVKKVADVVVRYVSVGEQIASHEITIPLQINLVSADEAAAAPTGLRRTTCEKALSRAAGGVALARARPRRPEGRR